MGHEGVLTGTLSLKEAWASKNKWIAIKLTFDGGRTKKLRVPPARGELPPTRGWGGALLLGPRPSGTGKGG